MSERPNRGRMIGTLLGIAVLILALLWKRVLR